MFKMLFLFLQCYTRNFTIFGSRVVVPLPKSSVTCMNTKGG